MREFILVDFCNGLRKEMMYDGWIEEVEMELSEKVRELFWRI